ncbi:class I SAM-dependent methyltransferase [Hippea alviniae]|uniref:class I SAM-dependent methyltransferase n=1 Tax=Hippea alviniae TaxID=1279027 RepID=UPI0003B72A24|nr:class I SAM-dependent methyltransferase [Hippea alviniae]
MKGVNIDLGSGDKGFSEYCKSIEIISYPCDYPNFDIEKDSIPHESESVDFITMNAVIEHVENPSNILSESFRVLKKGGFIFIRTPNWKMDWKDFYNDPTHVKPYSPETLKNTLELFNFDVIFLEPGLIEKSWFWKLPNFLKWKIAAIIKGGTKSIIAVGKK